MDNEFKDLFIKLWKKYFNDAELPICYYYTNQVGSEDIDDTKNENRCLIGNLKRVRKGHAFIFEAKSPGCTGGKRYSGFLQKLRPNFEYFLSCGIPGEMEGERYKKSPELVREYLKAHSPFIAPRKYLVFKRWDKLRKDEEPVAVIFFATADVLAGLFTLANYDHSDPNGVIAPMGAGCGSIIGYPLEESKSKNPKCVLGMFDVSARPHVPPDTLTFTIPMKRFGEMAGNMEESFLITESWRLVKNRLK
ncbi:MAG: hypothetical protein A2V66_02095 [Ignavibacteria bacterium RBG_13_36_8]|nr:MAG: hypothetical protein A2V66_02095 [Ignavibacteria bacterium RBG_13_36_8]